MDALSPISTEKTTKKRVKAIRSPQEASHKVIAFDVLRALQREKRSERVVAKLLEVPNSTMQSWRASTAAREVSCEVEAFFSTPHGVEMLRRIVFAAYQSIHFGCGGIRSLQDFLCLSKLNHFVASSEGALHAFTVRCEEQLIEIGEAEEKRLAREMGKRKVTAALDEMFRGKNPCLVAIEAVSNYILLEKFTEDRTAATWCSALQPRLSDLHLDLQRIVSDEGSGIRACAKSLGAEHTPELFHAQYELTKATSSRLAKQEKEFVTEVEKAEEALEKKIKRYGADSQAVQEAGQTRDLKLYGLEKRRERRKRAQEAIKEMGRIHHPIDLGTGKLQTAEEIKSKFDKQLNIVEGCAEEAELGLSCKKRLRKARVAFDSIVSSLTFLFTIYRAMAFELKGDEKQMCFFDQVIFPLCYLRSIWKRLSKNERDHLLILNELLENKLVAAAYPEELKQSWMKHGVECANIFQRSSSCVEGRNGMLSLYYHRFHRLSTRGLKALTIVHNFHTRRHNGKTAAERLFGRQHENLFESLVLNVRIPGKPREAKEECQNQASEGKKRAIA